MRQLNEDFLLDSYCETGSDYEEFRALLRNIEKHTHVEVATLDQISLLSHNPTYTNESRLGFYKLVPGHIWDTQDGLFKGIIPVDSILKKGNFQGIIDEYVNDNKLMMIRNGGVYLTSGRLMTTLSTRADISGNFMLTPTLERDIAIAAQFGRVGKATSMIVREFNGVRKIFAMLSEKYTYISQLVICDIIDSVKANGVLGTVKCHSWEVTNNMASIYVEFPDHAEELKMLYGINEELIPGLYIASSDTGDCSVTVRGTWRFGRSEIIQDEYKRRHSGDVDIKDIIEVAETKIFAEYAKLPEALCELMTMEITQPSWINLGQKEFKRKNTEAVTSVIKSVFKQLRIVDAIGKKNEKKLYEDFCFEIDPTATYTAYDIATAIMSLPERVEGINKVSLEQLQKTVADAPYKDYSTEFKEEVLTLVG